MNLPVWGSPVVVDQQVYFGLGNGRLTTPVEPPEKPAGALVCLDRDTGRQLWRYDVPEAVFARAAVRAGEVLFASRDGFCYALDRRTGKRRWRQAVGSPVVTGPTLLADRVYVVGSTGQVCCLDAASGEVRWKFDVASHARTRAQLFSTPCVQLDPESSRRRIWFGAELGNPGSTAAVLYCLED
jgi:outer membrane protein assembly factor BamB